MGTLQCTISIDTVEVTRPQLNVRLLFLVSPSDSLLGASVPYLHTEIPKQPYRPYHKLHLQGGHGIPISQTRDHGPVTTPCSFSELLTASSHSACFFAWNFRALSQTSFPSPLPIANTLLPFFRSCPLQRAPCPPALASGATIDERALPIVLLSISSPKNLERLARRWRCGWGVCGSSSASAASDDEGE